MTREEIVQASRDEEGGMYIVIPSVVKLDEELPLSAQMLYGIITWKCNKRAYTWATNRELGEALGVSPKRTSALLSLLEQRGHIETEIEYKDGTNEVLHRYIYPIMKSAKGLLRADPPPKNKGTPIPENMDTPPAEKGEPLPENAEVICNIKKDLKKEIKNTPYSPPAGSASSEDAEPVDKSCPAQEGWGFGPDLTVALEDWLRYKQEKRQGYKPTGRKTLVAKVKNSAEKYGEPAVADLIRQCMSSNWQGIIWEKLDRLDPTGENPQRGFQSNAERIQENGDRSEPSYNPEAFEKFWAAYPRKDHRPEAVRAWDKLKPDRELCRVMYEALKRQRRSEQWTKDDGQYIPLFSTWLDGERWKDQGVDRSLLAKPKAASGGWADGPGAAS